MGVPKVRLLLKGEPVQDVPFDRPSLRIGRMKENEVVINNLSVSRFHATLTREADGFRLKDLGSENGCWVNGRRVTESRVGPGDRIQIGKHQLEIVLDEEVAAPAAARPRSDAWDAAATYFVGPETQARMLEGAPAAEPPAEPLTAPLQPRDASAAPADLGTELFGRVEPDSGPPDLAEYDVSELELEAVDPEPARSEPAAERATALLPEEGAEEATVLVDEAAPEPPLHAGLLVQRHGRLERAIPWEGERLTLGRAAECDIVLATPEVSRRHALLVREGELFEVRDLESINGTFVNGEKVTRRALQVGDVVRVEDFEITFVLDRAPIGEAVRAAQGAPGAAPAPDAQSLTQLGEVLDLAPFVAEGDPEPAEAMSFDALPTAGTSLEAEPTEPATALLEEEPDEEKDLVDAPRDARVLRLELRLRLDELPAPLREALAAADLSELRLPVELRLATED